MNAALLKPCTVFVGHRRLLSGPLHQVALAVRTAQASGVAEPILVFDDHNGRPFDIDTRGSAEEVLARLNPGTAVAGEVADGADADSDVPRGRGRPKLGVVAREVTLLPRHWDWLSTQPGGASVALRKLVEEARRASGDRDRNRQAQESAYHFMSALAGDLSGFEEASRALFANDRARFATLVAPWPEDVRDHAIRLAFSDIGES